jgi:glucose/arabinose dehydrogenase
MQRIEEVMSHLFVIWTLSSAAIAAPTLPEGFFPQEVAPSLEWEAITGIAVAPDGRIFVAEKRGRIYVVLANVRLPTPFLEIESEVLNSGDRGLLGIALDPAFAENQRVYISYTVDPNGNGIDDDAEAFARLTRYTASAANQNIADPASRTVLVGESWSTGPASLSNSHTIGCLRFGLDGSLFMSAGDGALIANADAGGRNPQAFVPGKLNPLEDIGAFRSQWIGSLAGKVLRLDPETGGGLPSNPFYTGNPSDNPSRVWAYGLRNPFRFAVRPSTAGPDPSSPLPGVLYIADVGWVTWEELNVCAGPGQNFGWPCREGPVVEASYSAQTPAHHGCSSIGTADNPSLPAAPLIYWHHTSPSQSSQPDLVGKAASCVAFYTADRYPPEYQGACFFGDYEQSWIRRARVDDQNTLVDITDFATAAEGPVDIVTDPLTGDLLYVSILRSQIWRLRYGTATGDPVAVASANPTSGGAPLEVQFSSAGTSDPDGDPLTLVWLFGDGTVSAEPDPVHTYGTPGVYRAVLSVTDPHGGLGTTTVEVDVGDPGGPNHPPTALIIEPTEGGTFFPGVELFLRGTGTDAEDPTSSLQLTWEVVLHHNTHIHPDWLTFTGPTASFIPADHDDGTGVWFEVVLKVRDSGGLTGTQRTNVYPEGGALVLDNGEPGTSKTGSWPISGGLDPYGPNSLYAKVAGNTYTYTFQLASPGIYRIYAWWTEFDSRTTAAPYTIYHQAGTDSVTVNQQLGRGQWNYLGTHTFGSTAVVKLTGVGGNLTVCADAILLLPEHHQPEQPPLAQIDDISPAAAITGELVSFTGHGETTGTIQGYEWVSNIDGVIGTQPSFTTSSLSFGTHVIRFRVEDDREVWSEAAEAQLQVDLAPEVIIDNGGPGTSSTGVWISSGGTGAYGGGSLYSKIIGPTYVWQALLTQAGTYDVYAWWTAYASRTSAARYTIAAQTGAVSVTVDQRSSGGQWNLLGTVTFGAVGKVTLASSGAGVSTSADAVRFVLRGAGPPLPLVLDTGDPGTTFTGTWLVSGAANPYGGGSLYAKSSTSSYTYTFSLAQPGSYEVLAWWTTIASRSASVPYTVTHDAGATTVQKNQLLDSGQWNSLGTFHFTGSATIRIDALPDGKSYCADAVSVRRVAD